MNSKEIKSLLLGFFYKNRFIREYFFDIIHIKDINALGYKCFNF
jgi:hypothetical protein